MTNRTLTALAIRFAALLLFMKIFDYFGSYFLSVFYTASLTFAEEKFNASFDKFYLQGSFLLIANVAVSLFLFFKADWISTKLIRDDKPITTDLTAEKIIMSILMAAGIIWLAGSIFMLPDSFEYIQMIIARANHQEFGRDVDFSPVYFITKTGIALLFVFRVEKITRFLMKKIQKRESKEDSVEHDVHGDTAA